jgi:hypothetical protein
MEYDAGVKPSVEKLEEKNYTRKNSGRPPPFGVCVCCVSHPKKHHLQKIHRAPRNPPQAPSALAFPHSCQSTPCNRRSVPLKDGKIGFGVKALVMRRDGGGPLSSSRAGAAARSR